MSKVKIAPSLLAADFSNLEREVKSIETADFLHLDVMDGHFVPNITFGPSVIGALKKHSNLIFDVHLMIENPDQYIADFVSAGADMITVHAETCIHLHRTLQLIKSHDVKCGVVLNPSTPVDVLKHVLHEVDMILIMTVNPGFGGQKFLEFTMDKVCELVRLRQELGLDFLIQVDGGVNEETAKICIEAGVDVLVAGTGVFGAKDRAAAIKALREVK